MENLPVRVLIVDDNQDFATLISKQLRLGLPNISVIPSLAGSVKEARESIAACPADLYILDYLLQDGTGLDILRYLRTTGYCEPVIFLTGKGNQEAAVEVMKSGANDYLVKGTITHELLGPAVRHALEIYEKERQRQEAAEALRASESRFKNAFYRSLVGMTMAHLDGRYFQVNQAFCRMVGYSAEEILTRTFADITHPDDIPADRAGIARMLEGKARTHETERRYIHRDGRVIWVLVGLTVIETPSGDAILAQAQDITQRRLAEEEVSALNADLERRVQQRTAQLEAANKELEAFAYSVSHDLRAPLRGISGFSRILLEEYGASLDERGRHCLDRIHAGALRMGELIDDLLELSWLTRAEMRREPVELSALAHALIADLRSAHPDRQVETCVESGLRVEGDSNLLRVVLDNLLNNAWKFTSRKPEAQVEFGRRPGDGAFYVRDNGVGFDMQYAEKLFGAFQRLHAPAEFEGNGIGLATAQRIIHRHGGRIWAESLPDAGATFYFTLWDGAA